MDPDIFNVLSHASQEAYYGMPVHEELEIDNGPLQ